jgi:hypothetical protein
MSRPVTVALDLRLPGRAAAAAVDSRGALTAWALLGAAGGTGDPTALARRALRELKVKPREVRVLLGSEQAQVALLDHAGTPGEAEITAALFAEGYERLNEPSVAALAVSPGTWLVGACGAAAIEPLAAGLLEEGGTEPVFVVDQLLAAGDLETGSALVELGATGLLIAAAPPGSLPFVRSLPAVRDPEEAARESRESLEAAGFHGEAQAIQVRGEHRDTLCRLLADHGVAALVEALPASRGETLPAACELARRLALRPAVPRLASPQGEKRRTSLAWSRRAIRAALVLAALGGLFMMAGLRLTWVSRMQNRPRAPQAAGEARLVKELREIEVLVAEVERLRTELAGQTPPWPPLAEPVAALARRLPPEVGWERLEITDGALELEASASGTAPAARLELLRHALDSAPDIVNLSWAPPAANPQSPRLRQVFRAVVKGAPAAAPKGAR